MKRLWIMCLMLLLMCTGCAKEEQNAPVATQALTTDYVTLHAVTLGAAPASGLEKLYEQLDALTIPELGCVIRFDYIPWGDERNQLNIAVTSGEYDLIPMGNFSDYQQMVARNAFLDIKPYLHLVPDLVAHYTMDGNNTLAEMELDGCLYGIPQYGSMKCGVAEGFFYREDLRVEWGLKEITDLETLEAYLYRAKEDERFRDKPLITDNRVWTSLWQLLACNTSFEVLGVTETPYLAVRQENPYQVISRVETPEFRQVLEIIQRWYRDGILDKRLLTLSDNEGSSNLMLFLNGEKPCETNMPMWSIDKNWMPALSQAHPEWRYGFFCYESNSNLLKYKSGASASTRLTISSRSRYPEIALRLLEKVHTDQRYYDLLVYGVEGVHYHKDEDGVYYDGIAAEERYPGWTGAIDDYLAYTTVYRGPSNWAQEVYLPYLYAFEELEAAATVHPLNGFTLSLVPMGTQADAVLKAWETYMMPLLCGLATEDLDANLDEAIDQLYAAGLADCIAAAQLQLTEYQHNLQAADP